MKDFPITVERIQQDKPQLRRFECPRCHRDTFGRFEPFVERHVALWCSNCNYTEYDDIEAATDYIMKHPELIEASSEYAPESFIRIED